MNIWNFNTESNTMELSEPVKVGQTVRVSYSAMIDQGGKQSFVAGRMKGSPDKESITRLSVPGSLGHEAVVTKIKPAGTSDGQNGRGRKLSSDKVVITYTQRNFYNNETQRVEPMTEVVDPRALAIAGAFEAELAVQATERIKEDALLVKKYLPKGSKFDEMSVQELSDLSTNLSNVVKALNTRIKDLDLQNAQEQLEVEGETFVEAEAVTA